MSTVRVTLAAAPKGHPVAQADGQRAGAQRHRRYLEAARDLGASPWRAFWKVVVPLTMPGIVSGCMLVFLPGIGMFYVSDVLGGAKAMLLGNFIRDQFLTTRDWPLGAAASVTLTVLMGVMLLLYWKSSARLGGEGA